MAKGFMVKHKEPKAPDLFIYNEGVEMQGGTHFYTGYSGGNAGSCVENATNVVMTVPNGTRRFYGSTNKIDLTKYTKAYADVVINQSSYSPSDGALIIATSSTATNMDAVGMQVAGVAFTTKSGVYNHTFELDISALNGEYFVAISKGHSNNITLNKLWLEA